MTAADTLLREAFDVDRALSVQRSAGSVYPEAVGELLRAQLARYEESEAALAVRQAWVRAAPARVDALLAAGSDGPGPTGGRG